MEESSKLLMKVEHDITIKRRTSALKKQSQDLKLRIRNILDEFEKEIGEATTDQEMLTAIENLHYCLNEIY